MEVVEPRMVAVAAELKNIDPFVEQIQNASQDQLKIYARAPEVTFQAEDFTDLPYAQQMSHILVTGKELEVNFKCHFMLNNARALAMLKIGASEISDSQAVDFVKEYCNIVAGKIKSMCESQHFDLGQSLPFVMQGYNEMFYPADSGRIVRRAWRLSAANTTLTCSVKIDIRDDSVFGKLGSVQYKPESGNDDLNLELF